MPYNSAIELVNNDYGLLSSPRNLRSIRLKEDSFLSISRAWNKIRAFVTGKSVRDIEIESAENKLEKAQEEFKNLEFTPRDFSKGIGQVSSAEERIMKKAKAIAKLEEKLYILRDIPVSPQFVNNRAIKLKDNMIRNTRFNSHNAYSVPEEKKDDVFDYRNAAISAADDIIEKEVEGTSKSVQEIISESSQNVRDDVIVVPDRNEVKMTVDKEFSKQEEDYLKKNEEKVAEEVKVEPTPISREEVAETVIRDEVKSAVDEAIGGVNVSRNGAIGAKLEKYKESNENIRKPSFDSRPGISEIESIKARIPKIDISQVFNKVNNDENVKEVVEAVDERVAAGNVGGPKVEYFSEPANDAINEDGTYRLTRDQIDEDFRKTYINAPVEKSVEFDLMAGLDKEKKGDNEMDDVRNSGNNDDVSVRFDYDEDSVKNLVSAGDNGDPRLPRNEIEVLMERVRTLKQKQQESKERADKAAAQARASEDAKDDAFSRLRAYADALEEDSGFNNRSAEENMKKAQSNEKLVEDMLNMIQPQADPDSVRRR